jgi:hypothetical protein
VEVYLHLVLKVVLASANHLYSKLVYVRNSEISQTLVVATSFQGNRVTLSLASYRLDAKPSVVLL